LTTSSNSSQIPADHPRAESLRTRHNLVSGFKNGMVVTEGLIAHGRGEAFDYLLGERTTESARDAIYATAASLVLAERPVISINGNAAALSAQEIVQISKLTGAILEVNLFYRTEQREKAIEKELIKHGAKKVLGTGKDFATIPEIGSQRRHVDPNGIFLGDVVLVPLEDGDRTEALVKMGKTEIAIDLNPLSRTATAANITIVDNIVRAMPALVSAIKDIKDKDRTEIKEYIKKFNNVKNLQQSLSIIRGGVNE